MNIITENFSFIIVIVIILAIILGYCSRSKDCGKNCDYPHCYHCDPIDDDEDNWPKHGCC